MDDLFPLLMLLVFVLGPIIEGLKRKNRQNPPPPTQRRMPPRAPERQLPRQQQPSRMEEVSTRPREETAAGMVPEDLWEILTGQKRPPVLTTPQPAPPAERKRQQWDVVFDPDAEDEKPALESVAAEDVNVETRRGRRASPTSTTPPANRWVFGHPDGLPDHVDGPPSCPRGSPLGCVDGLTTG